MLERAQSIPVLASLDLDESETFFVRELGFGVVWKDETYLIVRRDAIELHFWLTKEKQFPANTSCYIRGGQIADLYEEFSRAAIDRLSDFSVRPWRMKEFYIHDPHGNLLRFGMEAEDA